MGGGGEVGGGEGEWAVSRLFEGLMWICIERCEGDGWLV